MRTNGSRALRQAARHGVLATLLSFAVVGCGTSPGSPTPPPAATSYEEFHGAFCAAWESLFNAVGNPDTGSTSTLGKELEAAIEAGDAVGVEAAARRIQDVLRAGRLQTAFGAGWVPSRTGMGQLDRLLAAMQALVEARRVSWQQGVVASTAKGQAAFEAAGGLDAWVAMIDQATWSELASARPSGAEPRRCANVPTSM